MVAKKYLSNSFRAGNVGMKSFDLGRGTSRNHSCCKAASADNRCKAKTGVLRLKYINMNAWYKSWKKNSSSTLPSQDRMLEDYLTDQNLLQTELDDQKKMQLGTYLLIGCTWQDKRTEISSQWHIDTHQTNTIRYALSRRHLRLFDKIDFYTRQFGIARPYLLVRCAKCSKYLQ